MSTFPHALSPTGSQLFPPGMSDSAARQWTLVLVLTALFLSLVVLGQIVARFGAAYWAAPREIVALLDSADSSLQENESYDRDVAKVPRLEDRIRLGHLLREIQRACDDLREDLNAVLVDSPVSSTSTLTSSVSSVSSTLTTSARLLWAAKRTRLEERLRRIDLLRMRFLVVHMGIITATATATIEKAEKTAVASTSAALATPSSSVTSSTSSTTSSLPSSPRFRHRDPDKTAAIVAASLAAAAANGTFARDDDLNDHFPYSPSSPLSPPPPPPLPPTPPPSTPRTPNPKRPNPNLLLSPLGAPPGLPFDLLESIRRKPPLRRVSTLPRTPDAASAEGHHRAGWMGVVEELQRSPLLHKRHTSVEMSATR